MIPNVLVRYLLKHHDRISNIYVTHTYQFIRTCGKRLIQHQERNSNGHSTIEQNWPWIAVIYHDNSTFKCAGTLIQSSIVLTAARCVFEENHKIMAHRVKVQLGKYNLDDSGSNIQEFQVIYSSPLIS